VTKTGDRKVACFHFRTASHSRRCINGYPLKPQRLAVDSIVRALIALFSNVRKPSHIDHARRA
jgi:hypothetical protein